MKRTVKQRLQHERETIQRHEEMLLARELQKSFPELTRSRALKHAYLKLTRESKS